MLKEKTGVYTMNSSTARCLFFMRITVFLVMLMWTLDKFMRPEHASAVYEQFYFSPALTPSISYLIGSVELVLLLAFLTGYQKLWSYGFVLLFHAISTFSSFQQYLAPFEGPNLLFFAAWPMLAACFTLFILRKEDSFLSIEK